MPITPTLGYLPQIATASSIHLQLSGGIWSSCSRIRKSPRASLARRLYARISCTLGENTGTTKPSVA
jgi:hypothetical protein